MQEGWRVLEAVAKGDSESVPQETLPILLLAACRLVTVRIASIDVRSEELVQRSE